MATNPSQHQPNNKGSSSPSPRTSTPKAKPTAQRGSNKGSTNPSPSTSAKKKNNNDQRKSNNNKSASPKPTDVVEEEKSKVATQESMWRKVAVRFVAGNLMLGAFYLTLQLPHRAFAGFLIGLQVMTWHEVVNVRYKQVKEDQLWGFRTIHWYFLFITFFFCYGKNVLLWLANANFTPELTHFARVTFGYYKVILFTFYLIGFVTFILSLRRETLRYQVGQLAWIILSLALIVGQTYFSVSYLMDGYVWIILPHGLIIFNDIMAYFFGMSFGRKLINRPLTSLSPNKTWEGFIGAMIATVVVAFYAAPLFLKSLWLICPADQYHPIDGCPLQPVFKPTVYEIPEGWRPILSELGVNPNWEITLLPLQIHAVVFALFASIIAPFGGFLASGIKRAFNKKDYQNIIPGHGGFMDRFDCQLLMCTFVYIYITTFIKTSHYPSVGVEKIFSQIKVLDRDSQYELVNLLQELLANG